MRVANWTIKKNDLFLLILEENRQENQCRDNTRHREGAEYEYSRNRASGFSSEMDLAGGPAP